MGRRGEGERGRGGEGARGARGARGRRGDRREQFIFSMILYLRFFIFFHFSPLPFSPSPPVPLSPSPHHSSRVQAVVDWFGLPRSPSPLLPISPGPPLPLSPVLVDSPLQVRYSRTGWKSFYELGIRSLCTFSVRRYVMYN